MTDELEQPEVTPEAAPSTLSTRLDALKTDAARQRVEHALALEENRQADENMTWKEWLIKWGKRIVVTGFAIGGVAYVGKQVYDSGKEAAYEHIEKETSERKEKIAAHGEKIKKDTAIMSRALTGFLLELRDVIAADAFSGIYQLAGNLWEATKEDAGEGFREGKWDLDKLYKALGDSVGGFLKDHPELEAKWGKFSKAFGELKTDIGLIDDVAGDALGVDPCAEMKEYLWLWASKLPGELLHPF